MKSCCFVVLFLVIVSCILVADAAAGYRNRKRSSDDSADSIINKIDADLNLEDGDIVERGLDVKRSSDDSADSIINKIDADLNLEDGDIIERGLDVKRSSFGDILRKRSARHGVIKWPGGVVPYKISRTFQYEEVRNIKAAMKKIEAKTCIKFRTQANSERHYLDFKRGRGCSSPIGMIRYRENTISLAKACTTEVGVVEHEIIHSLGFWHEQSRPDRDRYIKIFLNNVKTDRVHNFNKHADADTQGLAYDLESLMHYGNKDFSKNGKNTMESKAHPLMPLGTRKGMTALDIKGINILYDCAV